MALDTLWYQQSVKEPASEFAARAAERQAQLTKPPGSLGSLESLATRFAAWQERDFPMLDQVAVRVFAGDHGVTTRGVSAFPAEVTEQMVANFTAGGAAISVLAHELAADFRVVNIGLFRRPSDSDSLDNLQLATGTKDFACEDAMTEQLLDQCLAAGAAVVDELEADLFIAGDMGIGNTTSASALLAAVLGTADREQLAELVGPGTGVDSAGLARKIDAVALGLQRHGPYQGDWKRLLRSLGGLEIAAIAGAYLRCAQRGIPILLDGFITGSAALLAREANAAVCDWMIAGHVSAEPGHKKLLNMLALEPLLRLDMRLGEASGAALAVPLVKSALRLHSGMSTFAEASVSDA
ncbi:MAG: nicotinate-nucleotide--dimethylbenzimidazole phosphoribosyltransferase [Pseudomonadota bacterium]